MQAAQRRGSTEELSVLIAQYSLLVRRQASLRDVFQVRMYHTQLPTGAELVCGEVSVQYEQATVRVYVSYLLNTLQSTRHTAHVIYQGSLRTPSRSGKAVTRMKLELVVAIAWHLTVAFMQRQEQRLALLMPAFDEEVRSLAGQISESRLRVGIPDQDVFGGTGFSMRKLQLQTRDAAVSVQEGVDFFVLGVRMLFTDCGYSGRLFGRATFGATLKAREVSVCTLLPRGFVAVRCFCMCEWCG